MTPKQTQLYWREWSKAKKALESAMDPSGKTRLSAIEVEQRRHAIALEACGKQSSKDFTNKDLDKVLAAFRARSDPANLNAQLAQAAQPRKRMLWFIESCNPDYVATLLRERFNASDPSDLSNAELHQLTVTLKNRPKAHPSPQSPSHSFDFRSDLEPAFATASDPF